MKAKPKVKVNGQGCDCHLRWARETLSWPSFLPITNLWTSLALAWWFISSATKTVAAVNFVFLMASAGKLPLDELPGSASSFWSMAVVILNGWQCWVFTICVYLTESCGYCDGYGCGAVWWLHVALWCQCSWIQFLFHFGGGRATSFICTWGLVCCPQTIKLKSLILSSLYSCNWLYVKYLYSQYLQRFFQNCGKEGKWESEIFK